MQRNKIWHNEKKKKTVYIFHTGRDCLWFIVVSPFLRAMFVSYSRTQKSEWICDWYNFKAESDNMLLEHSNKDRITGARGVAAAEMLNEGLKFR